MVTPVHQKKVVSSRRIGYIAVYFHGGGFDVPFGFAIAGKEGTSEVSWSFLWVIFLGLLAAGVGGYAVYKYRIRVQLPFSINSSFSVFIFFFPPNQRNCDHDASR